MKPTLLAWVAVCATWAVMDQAEREGKPSPFPPLITAIDAPRLLKDCLNLKRWTSCLDKFDEEMGMIWYMTDDPEWMEQAYGKSLPKPPSVERALGLQIFESEEKARAAFERWRAVEPEIGWRTGTTPVVGEEMLWSGGRYVIFRVDNVIVHIATPVQEDPNDIDGKPEVWERVRPHAQRLCELLGQGQGGVQRGKEVRKLLLHLEPAEDPIGVGKGEEKRLTLKVEGLEEDDVVLLGPCKGPFRFLSLPLLPQVQRGFRASETMQLWIDAPLQGGEYPIEIPLSSLKTNVAAVLRRKVIVQPQPMPPAQEKGTYITGLDVAALLSRLRPGLQFKHKDLDVSVINGVRYVYRDPRSGVEWDIYVGLYQDTETAARVFDRELRRRNWLRTGVGEELGEEMVLVKPAEGGFFGNLTWWRHKNAMICLESRAVWEEVWKLAQEIEKSLREGLEGVTWGEQVVVPKISISGLPEEVEHAENPELYRSAIRANLTVAGVDPQEVLWGAKGAWIHVPSGEAPQLLYLPHWKPCRETHLDEITIMVATPGNVIGETSVVVKVK